jgi:two-component system sensor kinase FixL
MNLQRLSQGGAEETQRFDLRLLRKDGATVHVLMHLGAVFDGTAGPRMVVLSLLDRTTLLAKEHEAEDLRNRLAHVARINTMGEMATGIAHELNQPLSAITNYANASKRLIGSGQADLAEILGALDKIVTQAERAGEVIRRLRSMLVRRESNREPVKATQLVREVIRLAELELRERNIHLRLDLPEQLQALPLDAVQIQQVLINLIRNAMDAMAEKAVGSEIGIAVREADDAIEIAVSDAGPGVADAVAEHLFEPFYSTKQQGLGMGLAICRSIVQAHGGTLTFSNNRYGGATFLIRLPVGT